MSSIRRLLRETGTRCTNCLPVIAALLILTGCATNRPVTKSSVPPPSSSSSPSPSSSQQRENAVYERGEASYYDHSFDGQETASGETYSPNRLTAAHRSLPFGTRVRVTDTENGRHVTVRINDRGPFESGRIIDLSKRAAKRLHMTEDGTTPVTLRIVSEP